MNPLDVLVRKLASQAELDAEAVRALEVLPVTIRRLEPSTYLLREGETPDRCAVMLSGFAYRQKLVENGARQIVALHVAGDPLDFQTLFLHVADHNIQTLSRAEVAFIPRDDLRRLVRANPLIAQALEVNVTIEASISREWILNIGRRNAPERLAHLLCELAVRLNVVGLADEFAFTLPMTQEQIGDALGLTSVHVNRTLKNLEARALIERDKRFVRIRDWTGLRDLSGFNSRYLHLGRQADGLPG